MPCHTKLHSLVAECCCAAAEESPVGKHYVFGKRTRCFCEQSWLGRQSQIMSNEEDENGNERDKGNVNFSLLLELNFWHFFSLSPPPPRCILYELFPHDSSEREKSVCKLCDDDFRENLLKCISYVNERNISIYSLIVELCWAYCVELKIAFNPLALSDFRWFSFHQFPYEMACAHKLRQLRLKTHQTWRERRAL